jgi:hypothetical protein
LAYNIHSEWDNPKVVGANTDLPSVFESVQYFLNDGVSPSKMLVLRLVAAYRRFYVLSDPSCSTAGCTFSGAGSGGCAGIAGFMPYFAIHEFIQNGNYDSISYNPNSATMELVVNGNNLISFDKLDTMQIKYNFASMACFRGIMWCGSTGMHSIATRRIGMPPHGRKMKLCTTLNSFNLIHNSN